MKLLLVLGSDDAIGLVSENIKPLGFDLIRYRHVLKAMDNIDEIDPAGIIISATDFPRHWKTLVQFVRYGRPKDLCPIVVLTGKNFSPEEAAKAFHIGVSGLVPDNVGHDTEIDRLQSILGRYIQIEEKRKAHRYPVEAWNRIGFCMVNPLSKALITTTVKTISRSAISFVCDDPILADTILEDEEVSECSLRIGDAFISPICRLIRREPAFSMEFIFMEREEQIALDTYLESIPLQETRQPR
jgi:hypothetical protein